MHVSFCSLEVHINNVCKGEYHNECTYSKCTCESTQCWKSIVKGLLDIASY